MGPRGQRYWPFDDTNNSNTPDNKHLRAWVCVCWPVGRVLVPQGVTQAWSSHCPTVKGGKASTSWKQQEKKKTSDSLRFTVGDFQSSHHHSFMDSSGSASIPSSLIHKLRAAILIALRTLEVFNGLFCSRGIRTCQPAEETDIPPEKKAL